MADSSAGGDRGAGGEGREDRGQDDALAASAFEQLPFGVFGLEGPDLRFVTWNDLARSLGEPAVTLGTSVFDAGTLVGSGIHEALRRVATTGETVTESEWQVTLPDETGRLVEHHIDFTYSPWRRPDGSVRGVVGSTVDVTAAVERRRAVQAQADRWQDRFRTSRQAMVGLQEALLPSSVPVLPGLELGARYLVTEADTAAGGDWFSTVVLPDGRVAVVVGDVVGHGLGAAAVMAQLRTVLEERLGAGEDPPAALAALDAFVRRTPAADGASVCLAVVDPSSGAVGYCTAGHPPPLVVTDEGWRYLEPTGAGLLGGDAGHAWSTDRLGEGDVLLLYTDGMLERPGVPRAQATVELGQVAQDAVLGRPVRVSPGVPAVRVSEQVLEHLTRSSGHDDDITLVAVRRVAPVPPLALRLTAGPGTTATATAAVVGWLLRAGAEPLDVDLLRHVALELVSNSVEHAPAAPDSVVVVEVAAALARDGTVRLEVADDGVWRERADGDVREPEGDLRGIGLALARRMTDDLAVERSPAGTRVVATRRLGRVVDVRGQAPGGRAPTDGSPASVLDEELVVHTHPARADVTAVRGPVVTATVEALLDGLRLAAGAGTRDLVVDLSEATHLASVGVRVLRQVEGDARASGTAVTFWAPAGSVADQVLRMAGLSVTDPPP